MGAIRIGVNALYLIPGGVGGTEIYLRSLLAALAEIDSYNQYVVFTNRETAGLAPDRPNFAVEPQPVRATFRPARILWEQAALPVAAARRKLDVLFNPGFTAPLLAPCPSVTVFHDLQHKRYPEHFRWFDLPFWRLLLYAAAHRSKRLIAVSEATRADLVHYYHLPAAKITVAPHGVDPMCLNLAWRRRDGRFILCVSTLHPHKNLDRLLRAFAIFHAQHEEYRLVLAGLRGFHTEALERLCAQLRLQDAVRFTGWVPREQLYELYAAAAAFVYPSRFEGFGMPVLEALAAGIPAAISNIEPLRSVAGDAALRFDPEDSAEIARALGRITMDQDLRRRLEAEGPRQAARFSWVDSARITLDTLISTART